MSTSRWIRVAVAGAGATAAALTAGALVERRVVRSRRAGAAGADRLGGLRGDRRTVRTPDGVDLFVEVDEVAPYGEQAERPAGHPLEPAGPTVVFVHGYALSLECWHFQRTFLRGKHRMVFYDQRSHGRSGRSDAAHATLDQLADDLAQVLAEVVPEGPVVLVGHSMGGMTLLAFAERHRAVFDERVVGAALVSTAAGGLKTHHLLSRFIPDRLAGQVAPRIVAGLALAPSLVDRVRRRGSNLGFLVAEEFAFGGEVPASYVEFVNDMLAATSFEVLAHFFPNFDSLDRYAVLGAFARVPTLVVGGTEDVITPLSHSRRIASSIPGATLVEVVGAGHMVILEEHDRVDAVLADLLARVAASPAGGPAADEAS